MEKFFQKPLKHTHKDVDTWYMVYKYIYSAFPKVLDTRKHIKDTMFLYNTSNDISDYIYSLSLGKVCPH